MATDPVVTADLSDFGYRELGIAAAMLTLLASGGKPNDFDFEGVTLNLNRSSGYVFLSNENYDCAMLHDGKLETWYNLPYAGAEGFLDDLLENEDYESLHREDQEALKDLCHRNNRPVYKGYFDPDNNAVRLVQVNKDGTEDEFEVEPAIHGATGSGTTEENCTRWGKWYAAGDGWREHPIVSLRREENDDRGLWIGCEEFDVTEE